MIMVGSFLAIYVFCDSVSLCYRLDNMVICPTLITVVDNYNCEFEGFKVISYNDEGYGLTESLRLVADDFYVPIDALNKYKLDLVSNSTIKGCSTVFTIKELVY